MVLLLLVALLAAVPLPGDASSTVRFAVVSDQTGSAMPGVYDAILAEVARMDPDFIVTVGDQIEGYLGPDTTALHAEYDSLFAQYDRAFGSKWREDDFLVLTPGNHDITDDSAEPIWMRRVGPTYRRVDTHGVTIFVLDNSRRSEEEGIAPEQFEFLERELAGLPVARPVLVLLHKPYFDSFIWRDLDDPVHRLFVSRGVDAVLAGHWHTYVYDRRDGVQYMVCGSSGGGTGGQGLDNGELLGFVWGTVRDGDVSLTPISRGSIHPPDIILPSENQTLYAFRQHGAEMSPIEVDATSASVSVVTRNRGTLAAFDSLHWTLPEGWSISPTGRAFELAPGDSAVTRFEMARNAPLFPLPTLTSAIEVGRGKRWEMTQTLRLDRSAHAVRADRIDVDGRLSEPVWRSARPETLLMAPGGGSSQCDPCAFRYAYDEKGIYLSAESRIEPEHPVVAEITMRDGPVHREDCVGWFLSPVDSLIYQIYVNPNGVIFDGRGRISNGQVEMDYSWNGEYRIAATRTESSWSVELLVPYATLGLDRAPSGSGLWLNMRRKQRCLESAADWLPIEWDPSRLGTLVFVE